MDIHRLKRMLVDRAESVAAYLLPNGGKDGAEWRAGSVNGEKGKSLGVHLTGAKAGVWADFAADQHGDLIDLWCMARNMPLTDALAEIAQWLGVERPEPYRDPRPAYVRPPKPICTRPVARVLDYLTEDRNIPEEIVIRYKIGEAGDRIVFPFLLPDGTLAMAKTREAVAGAAPKPTAKDCEPIVFGWQAIPADARHITITEGEIDTMAMAAYGWPAVSVPFGGGKGRKQQNWIENDFERFERFEKIYLALDMDQPGEEACTEIAARLGRHRCYRVKMPFKDADECLMSGISAGEMRRCMEAAEALDPEGLRRPSAFTDKVVHLFWPADGEMVGYSMPYQALRSKLVFRPGEMTVWSGGAGAGKSQVISDCIPKWIRDGARVCVASLEMQPQWQLKRLVKQAGGVDRPSVDLIERALTWLDTGLLLYEKVGKTGVASLLEVFDYSYAKYGCDVFVVDSLMRLGIASDDYVAQERAVFELVEWADLNGVHLHMVAHSRKGDRDMGVPELNDVKGAGEITANVHNVITIWRDRKHEDAVRKTGDDLERGDVDEKPGVILNVCKQRNGDFEGRVGLWFNRTTYQYFSKTDNRAWPRSYVDRPDAPDAPELIADEVLL